MANQIEAVNTIAITNIEAINTITDDNLQALNTLEFTGVTDAHVLISTPYDFDVHGNVDEVTITSGIDDTYAVYEFHIVIHPETDNKILKWQANAASGSNTSGYNQNITSTGIRAYHQENGTGGAVDYDTYIDQKNSDQALEYVVDNVGAGDTWENMSAILTLYDPSSTTYIKHFTVESSTHMSSDGNKHELHAGYINAEEAIDEIKFVMSDGQIQGGFIKMYGISKS